LAGEGLIEDRRGMGFFAWRLDAVDLVELYDLQTAYLTTALERGAGAQLTVLGCGREVADFTVLPHGTEPPVVRLEAVFAMLVAEARSAALARAHGLLADRLAPSRHAERAVLSDTADELVALERAVLMLDHPAILQVLTDYHRRRTARAPQIVAAMRASAVGGGF
jgi:hypothetical protein